MRRGTAQIVERLNSSTTKILGEGRSKQIDVILSDWDRGLELAVSTKTLALGVAKDSELLKNLPNRWEEFDGDLKNLRGRFPLAAIGALLLVPERVFLTPRLLPVIDMMMKITAPNRDWVNAYDAACVVGVGSWQTEQNQDVEILSYDGAAVAVPDDLLPDRFFSVLLGKVLERSPVGEHRDARRLRGSARGLDTSLLEDAFDASDEAADDEGQ
jgi:hypothetical protein